MTEEPGPPASVEWQKEPVDLRVLQANERTFLAWMRTGLALMAFGFVVARIAVWLRLEHPEAAGSSWSVWMGTAFVLLGTATNGAAALRYVRVRRLLLERREVRPGNSLVLVLAVGMVVLGAVLIAYLAAI